MVPFPCLDPLWRHIDTVAFAQLMALQFVTRRSLDLLSLFTHIRLRAWAPTLSRSLWVWMARLGNVEAEPPLHRNVVAECSDSMALRRLYLLLSLFALHDNSLFIISVERISIILGEGRELELHTLNAWSNFCVVFLKLSRGCSLTPHVGPVTPPYQDRTVGGLQVHGDSRVKVAPSSS